MMECDVAFETRCVYLLNRKLYVVIHTSIDGFYNSCFDLRPISRKQAIATIFEYPCLHI